MKKWTSLILCVCVLLLAGCGKAETSTSDTSKNEAGESKNFIFVCPIVDNVYWQECVEGIEKADAEFGTTTTVIGPQTAENFVKEIVTYMESAIEQKPDGILVYAGIEGLYPLINDAYKQGIPVISIDSDAPDTKRVAFVGTKAYTLGYDSGKFLADLTGEKASAGYICTSKSTENELVVFNAFKDAISDYDIEVLDVEEGLNDTEASKEAAKTMLQTYPEISAIYCTGGYNVTGAAAAIEELGREDVVLIGMEDTDENLQYVRDGVIDALYCQNPYQMGYDGVRLLKKYLENGGLDEEIYDVGYTLITEENVDTY